MGRQRLVKSMFVNQNSKVAKVGFPSGEIQNRNEVE
jgi:hypothetical protein